uniref:Uncharacterized protein n=1 Tax=Calidris pygmaea TaxID=425635 RepID=A0A8C3J774_9CHAR
HAALPVYMPPQWECLLLPMCLLQGRLLCRCQHEPWLSADSQRQDPKISLFISALEIIMVRTGKLCVWLLSDYCLTQPVSNYLFVLPHYFFLCCVT